MFKQFVGLAVSLLLLGGICFANPKGQYHYGKASWNAYAGTHYASKGLMITASRDYPCGSVIKVINLKNKKEVTVTVRDWGPARWTGRCLDLSKEAFRRIANPSIGEISVKYKVIKIGNRKHEKHRH